MLKIPFHTTYSGRVMGRLTVNGVIHEPVELFRTPVGEVLTHWHEKTYAKQFDPLIWDVWVERIEWHCLRRCA